MLYQFLKRKLTAVIILFIICLCVMLAISSKVKLIEDITQMFPSENGEKSVNDFLKNSNFSDRIVINLSANNANLVIPDTLVEFSNILADQLNTKFKNDIKSIDYTTNDSLFQEVLSIIKHNLPIFLEAKDYFEIDTLLTQNAISEKIKENFITLTSPSGLALKDFIVNDPLGLNYIVFKKLNGFQLDENIELFDNHFVTKDKKNLLLFVNLKSKSSETVRNTAFFKQLDQEIKEITRNSNLNISYFGETAITTANAAQIRKDSFFTSIFTIFLLIILFGIFFKNFKSPILVMLPVIFGALFALTLIYFIKGEISIIAVGAGSIVLGIAVNYSLHFLTHYLYHPNKEMVIKDLAFPMIIGSTTTIGGFLCLQFLTIPVLQDLGLFAAFSLIGAALSTLIFLPHFLPNKNEFKENKLFDRLNLGIIKLPSNKYVVIIFTIITIILFQFAGKVGFENDMMKMNYMSPQLKTAEQKINSFSSIYKKSVFVIAKGNTMEAALNNNEQIIPQLNALKDDGKIFGYTNPTTILPSNKEQIVRIEKWNKYWTTEKRNETLSKLIEEGKQYHFNAIAFNGFLEQTSQTYFPLTNLDKKNLKKAILDKFIDEKKNEVSVINIIKTKDTNTENIISQFKNNPNVLVINKQNVLNRLVKTVGKDFNLITILTTIFVFVMLLLSYGRIELALIAFIPMIVSWIWILGLMALFGIKFNIINIILSTFVFALGDDFCIFTMDSMLQSYASRKKMETSVRVSILLSATTTILGLGILIFAKHPAMKSIALVSIIGIICVWLMSQTLQPYLFNILIKNQTEKKRFPLTFFGFLKSLFAFSYFIFGAFLLSAIGFVLIKLVPFQRKKMKYVYHYILSKFVGSLVYGMANVRKKIINKPLEDFSKPSVIIANHQSFLDILALLMLHPKIIMLTNEWVWNSPVFGYVVRLADFQLADNTPEKIDLLAKQVKEGYSIMVFPEGTRNKNGQISRFHKGAFYLAEQLKLDVLPIVLHGTGYCMTKGEFLLKNGSITLKTLDRIKPDDLSYGIGYSERTTKISKYFKTEFANLSQEIETASYYKEQLFNNFIFKGPVLEWYMKIKVRLEKNYTIYDELIPKNHKILDIGCGYGFLSYILSFTGKEREILGLDYDAEKISIAQNGFLRSKNLDFKHQDILNFKFKNYDTIILSDVLHYLQPKEREFILLECVKSISADGMIIIRDGDAELKEKHKGTKLTELFSTQIIGFNKMAESGLSFLTYSAIQAFADANRLKLSRIDHSKYTSNVFLILKKA